MKSLAIDCRSINKEKTGVGNVLINTLSRLNMEKYNITLFFDRDLDIEEEKYFNDLGYKIEIIKCAAKDKFFMSDISIFKYKSLSLTIYLSVFYGCLCPSCVIGCEVKKQS